MYTTFKKDDIMVNAWALAASIMDKLMDAFEADNKQFDASKFEHAVWNS